MEIPLYEKRGYLDEDYRLFTINDRGLSELDYHYHEFHKVLILRDGQADYSIEGRHYALEKNDIVLIPRGYVHRPEVEADAVYSRVILYISPEFLRRNSTDRCDLEQCFDRKDSGCVARLHGDRLKKSTEIIRRILEEDTAREFGSEVMIGSLVIELTTELCRWSINPELPIEGMVRDNKIIEILTYINENLNNELSIDSLADRFYISKYHMMRRFRCETGYTIHSYITNKRLRAARQMISDNLPANYACFKCGFRDYSTFSRAYKKLFGDSPAGRNNSEIR